MSRAIHIEGVLFLSASEAGKRFGFTNDYIARLAREEKIAGRRIGNQWFVDPDSLRRFKYRGDEEKMVRKQELRALRKRERALAAVAVDSRATELSETQPHAVVAGAEQSFRRDRGRLLALVQSGCVVGAGTVLGALVFLAVEQVPLTTPRIVSMETMERIAYGLYHFDVPFGDGANIASVALGTQDRALPDSVETVPADNRRGMVILDEDSTETEESVESYFSDEVNVAVDSDGQSGVIEPVFKSDREEQYRFLLVPIRGP